MTENHEQRKPTPPPEPKVMPAALVARENMEHVPQVDLRRLEPKVMPAAIQTFQKAKKP